MTEQEAIEALEKMEETGMDQIARLQRELLAVHERAERAEAKLVTQATMEAYARSCKQRIVELEAALAAATGAEAVERVLLALGFHRGGEWMSFIEPLTSDEAIARVSAALAAGQPPAVAAVQGTQKAVCLCQDRPTFSKHVLPCPFASSANEGPSVQRAPFACPTCQRTQEFPFMCLLCVQDLEASNEKIQHRAPEAPPRGVMTAAQQLIQALDKVQDWSGTRVGWAIAELEGHMSTTVSAPLAPAGPLTAPEREGGGE